MTALAPYPPLTGTEPCRQPDTDPDMWFDEDGEAAARALCFGCPVRTECLSWALDHPKFSAHGIWAATTPKRRAQLRREFTATDKETAA